MSKIVANRIINSDCIEGMKALPDACIDCCVTSPPYFGLRDYGNDGQIGLEETPEAFVAKMVEVFTEVKRILKPEGTLFLNLGDSYFSGSRREAACDTSGKEPVNYQVSDCLCQSLCDACRVAYQIGKSHKGSLHVPKQVVSPFSPIQEYTEFENDHAPTSDFSPQASHILDANQDLKNFSGHEPVRLTSFQESKPAVSSLQQPASSHLLGSSSSCHLCGRSCTHDVLYHENKTACTCDIDWSGHPLNLDKSGISSLHTASSKDTDIKPQCTLKPKDLIGIPWMVAFALRSSGWYLRQDIIWSKPNPMPESVQDRCTKSHEYIFMLSKSSKYYYDNESIKTPAINPQDDLRRLKQQKEDNKSEPTEMQNGLRSRGDKQRGHSRRHAGFNDRWDHITKEEQISMGANKRSVWNVATKPFSEAHFATFPQDLIIDCIKAGSPVDGIVLDPFMGAGTTALVSSKLNRNYIGFELNPDYIKIAENRLSKELGMFKREAI